MSSVEGLLGRGVLYIVYDFFSLKRVKDVIWCKWDEGIKYKV